MEFQSVFRVASVEPPYSCELGVDSERVGGVGGVAVGVLNYEQLDLEGFDYGVEDVGFDNVPGLIESPADEEDEEWFDSDYSPDLYGSKMHDFTLSSEEDNLWMNSDYITCLQSVRTDTLDSVDKSECDYDCVHSGMVVDEKDTLFGLGVIIGGTAADDDLNGYICTLERKEENKVVVEQEEKEGEDKVEGQVESEETEERVDLVVRRKRSRKSNVEEKGKKCGRKKKKKKIVKKKKSNYTEENKFICADCGKGFPRKSNHDSHIRMHLKIKPHKCSQCEKAFVRRSDLNRHERSLHWKTNFKCNGENWGCGHVYSRKDGLRKHWKTNQGVECLKNFLRVNALYEFDAVRDIERIIELTKVFK